MNNQATPWEISRKHHEQGALPHILRYRPINTNNQHITLPLEALFERLGNAGFDCSPAARTRAYRLLAVIGPQAPEPGYLRGMLAPLFARSADEQKRFYEIFDRYWLEITKIAEPGEDVVKSPIPYRKYLKTTGWALLALALTYVIYINWPPKAPEKRPEPSFTLNAPPDQLFNAGYLVRCQNTTDFQGIDSTKYTYQWRIERIDGKVEVEGPTDTRVWEFPAPLPDLGADRQVVLTQHHKTNKTVRDFVVYQNLFIACPNRPAIPRLTGSTKIETNKPIHLAVTGKLRPGLKCTWALADTTILGTDFVYQFGSEQGISLLFSVTDTTQAGKCSRDTIIYLENDQQRVKLPYKTLQYDKAEPVAQFRWPLLVLLIALGFAAGWFWNRWRKRKAPPLPETTPQSAPGLPEGWGQASDKPPYYIPFRDQKGVFKTAKEQFQFGDALRLRQEGEDAVLDVPDTLRATVEGGGYPNFRYRFRTRPSEYLFLIDEQMPGKHLARLFRQLAENLRGREVLLEILWYDPDFRRFWGPGLPKGVHADQLRRLYPQHRLVLLGDAHNLLDPFSDAASRLRPGLEAELQGWKERLLLTPQAPDAWNWRERVLYRHFGLFPADLRGMLDAAVFVENGLDTEDLPARFEDWQAAQTAARSERADTNYRRWRTLRDHEDYLQAALPGAFRDMRRWLCALAVLPNPTWEITLAVAHALGITVTHDRLLTLARIPWLQDGKLNPRLRRELLAALSEEDETLARTALRDELEAVQALTADSHAAHELEGALAVQQFLLAPDDADRRNLIAVLLDAGALTRVQEDELDLAVERWDKKAQIIQNESVATTIQDGGKRGIRAWLNAQMPEPEEKPLQPPKPFFTKDFWWALGCTALLLCLGGFAMRYSNTKELREMMFPWEPFVPGRDTLRENILVKEDWVVDSSLIYNNLGVYYGSTLFPKTDVRLISSPDYEKADAYFTLAKRGFDPVVGKISNSEDKHAWLNNLNNTYNYGAWFINQHFNKADSLQKAVILFEKVLIYDNAQKTGKKNTKPKKGEINIQLNLIDQQQIDALVLDAKHGKGISAFYLKNRREAEADYFALNASHYFDTIPFRPNLQTLLGIAPPPPFTITLQWQNRDDLDLLVQDPSGHITGLNDTEFTQGNYKISLAKGANGSVNTLEQNPEERIAVQNPLLGTYQIYVSLYKKRDAAAVTPFKIIINNNGVSETVQGKISRSGDKILVKTVLIGQKKETPVVPQLRPIERLTASQPLNFPVPEMIFVQGGTFRMGSTDADTLAGDGEKPAHDVTLSSYFIGKTEVTNAQYAAFLNDYQSLKVKNGPYAGQEMIEEHAWGIKFPTQKSDGLYYPQMGYENHPVIYVSWYGAVEYCNWLSQKTGKKYRLPTEAEWEYAARGGAKWKDGYVYSGGNDLDLVAWYRQNSYDKGADSPDFGTHSVAQKKTNQLGTFDMTGNVWEWCSDWHDENYYKTQGKRANNPIGLSVGSVRVLRGGSWYYYPQDYRVAYRNYGRPTYRLVNIGFRLARTN